MLNTDVAPVLRFAKPYTRQQLEDQVDRLVGWNMELEERLGRLEDLLRSQATITTALLNVVPED